MRIDNRKPDELRAVKLERNFTRFAPGSVLIQVGNTKVLCTATIEDTVPPHLKNSGQGWITAEYSLLPGSTQTRTSRESTKGKIAGRTHEIQRLIGRAMRAVVKLSEIGERTIWIDCDVLQADGGTRTASITGGYVALVDALRWLQEKEQIKTIPITDSVAAVSVGLMEGTPILDLCYEEDVNAQVDMNIVITGSGYFVEVQGTGEEHTFTEEQLIQMLSLAKKGIKELTQIQKASLGTAS
ncbi:MAG TPA: ribonuclease PH [Candidatus Brocadiia bacterium]|nr:ribonuclease PH [Candidatus Brocadiales bacterium]